MSKTRFSIGVVCAGLTAGIVLALTLGQGAARTGRALQPPTCQLANPQPAEPLELNTVAVGVNLVKSVAMEKELFTCTNPGAVGAIKDHETFVEIVERRVGSQFLVASRRVEESVCTKDFATGSVSCRVGSIPLPSGLDPTPLKGCRPLPQPAPPTAFVRMTSATVGDFVKTVKVDKEIFDCSQRLGQPTVGDIYIFTEIIEGFTANGFGPISKTFEGIACYKVIQSAVIHNCSRFTV